MPNEHYQHFARLRFIAPICLIVAFAALLVACDNNPAPVAPTPTATVVATPSATVVAMLPSATTLVPTATAGAMLPTDAASATVRPVLPTTPPGATPCPTAAPPPTLTPAPPPSDYAPGTPQRGLPNATLQFLTSCRTVIMRVQIASTEAQQEQGLMGRINMAQDEGMLFDFGRPDSADTFWMKNTPNPLSIAFISGDLYVVTLDEMAAFDSQTFHASTAPYQYAVEANAGFFTRYGVKVGDKVEIIRQ